VVTTLRQGQGKFIEVSLSLETGSTQTVSNDQTTSNHFPAQNRTLSLFVRFSALPWATRTLIFLSKTKAVREEINHIKLRSPCMLNNGWNLKKDSNLQRH